VEFEDATVGDDVAVATGSRDASEAAAEHPAATVLREEARARATVLRDPTLKRVPASRLPATEVATSHSKKATAPTVLRAALAREKREELLRMAPVVAEPEKVHVSDGLDVFANRRGLEIEGHWGPTDDSAVVPVDRLAAMNRRVSVYKPKAKEIAICGARLPNGRLCQRRDRKICPFHGPIVARDANGYPLAPTVSEGDGGLLAGGSGGGGGRPGSSKRKSQRELEKEANLKILEELSGGKKYRLPGDVASSSSSRSKAEGNGGKKRKGKGKGKEPLTHKERIHQKLFNPKKNKIMKNLLTDMAEKTSRNRTANKW